MSTIKNKNINLRCAAQEKSRIYGAAEKAGITPAVFVRDAALRRAGGMTSEDRRHLAQILGQVGKLGNNVNQVARLSWQSGSVDPVTIERLTAELAALRQEVREALG
jgi:hypothetical protein